MDKRLELHELLKGVLGSDHVYYQPPESVRMQYPAIVYSRKDIGNRHANDGIYRQLYSYDLTVIDFDPDSELVQKVAQLPKCRFNRHYTADGLNHDVFTIYY